MSSLPMAFWMLLGVLEALHEGVMSLVMRGMVGFIVEIPFLKKLTCLIFRDRFLGRVSWSKS